MIPDFVWPYLLVEKRFPEVVNEFEPAGQRLFTAHERARSARAEEFLVSRQPRGEGPGAAALHFQPRARPRAGERSVPTGRAS